MWIELSQSRLDDVIRKQTENEAQPEYDELLNDFIESDFKTVRVEYSDRSTDDLLAGLSSRIKARELDIKLITRGGKLYLTKE